MYINKNNYFKIKKKKIWKKNNNIIFKKKIKKYFLKYLIDQSCFKKRLKYKLFLKRRKIENIITKNYKNLNLILKNKLFIRMSIYRKRKNVFLNFSNIFSGEIYTNYSAGHYYKHSLRRTYYAIESLLLKSIILKKKFLNKFWISNKRKKKIWLFLMIKGNYFSKGFKKNLKKFITQKKRYYKIYSIKNVQFKAHNGIRKKSKRRK